MEMPLLTNTTASYPTISEVSLRLVVGLTSTIDSKVPSTMSNICNCYVTRITVNDINVNFLPILLVYQN